VFALFGAAGTGKTHLAHGLVRAWQEHGGLESAAYMTAGDFRRQCAAAFRDEQIVEFRRLVRGRRLLAIDDLHQLPAADYVFQELRYTLDDYEERGGIVLVTSHRPTSTMGNLPAELRSRFASGLALQLAPPGAAARLRIVQQTSTAVGRSLADHVARRLADSMSGTTADLIGALFTLLSLPDVDGNNARIAGRLVAERQPTLQEIVTVVARYTNIPQKQLKSASRKQSIVFARALVVYLARELAGASYHTIGQALGGRDHTTIMHNHRKIDEERCSSLATQEVLDELRRILTSR
jgi:chromosomal replication initiator protein